MMDETTPNSDETAEREALLDEIAPGDVALQADYSVLSTAQLRRSAANGKQAREDVRRHGRLGALWRESEAYYASLKPKD